MRVWRFCKMIRGISVKIGISRLLFLYSHTHLLVLLQFIIFNASSPGPFIFAKKDL
jgi:hypothetical protein